MKKKLKMLQVRLTIINGQDIRGISAGSRNLEAIVKDSMKFNRVLMHDMYLTIKVIYDAEIVWEHFGFKKIFQDRVN